MAMSTVILVVVMSLAIKILGWVALERRGTERRERATLEVANLMERLTAYPYEQVTPELARKSTLSTETAASLPGAELKVDVAANEPAKDRSAKRIAIQLRWRNQQGDWVAPVRLTSWIERRRPSR
jgi:hypothetical protein